MNLAILVLGAALAIVAGRSATPRPLRRAATAALLLMLLAAPLVTSTTSVLFDVLVSAGDGAMNETFAFAVTGRSVVGDAAFGSKKLSVAVFVSVAGAVILGAPLLTGLASCAFTQTVICTRKVSSACEPFV